MSWQLFTLIQVGVFALAAIAALLLRNRGLHRRNDQLLSLCSQAHEELVNVTGKLTEIENTASPEQLLAERARTLSGDDVVVTLRRLVLENEIAPSPDFTLQLSEYLRSHAPEGDGGAGPDADADGVRVPPEEEFVRRWRQIREECQQLAMFLVADQPEFLPAVRQLFGVFEPLDRAYHIQLPAVELPHRSDREAGADEDPDAMDQAELDALLAEVQASAGAGQPAAQGSGDTPPDGSPGPATDDSTEHVAVTSTSAEADDEAENTSDGERANAFDSARTGTA